MADDVKAQCIPTTKQTRANAVIAICKETSAGSAPAADAIFTNYTVSQDSGIPSFSAGELDSGEIAIDRMETSSKETLPSYSWDTDANLSISMTLAEIIAAMFMNEVTAENEVYIPMKPGKMTTYSYMAYLSDVKQSMMMLGSIPKTISLDFSVDSYAKQSISWGAEKLVEDFGKDQPYQTKDVATNFSAPQDIDCLA